MKKIIISLFTFLLLNTMVVGLCFSSTDIGEAMKILPESTDFVIKFSSTKDFYEHLSVTDKSFLGQPIEEIDKIKDDLGFNPFDLKDLESNGLDVAKPFGIAISDFKIVDGKDTPSMNVMIFLPVKDVDKAVAKIKAIIEENNPGAQFTKKGDVWSWNLDIDSSEPEDLEAVDAEDEETDPAAGKEEETETGDTTAESQDLQAKIQDTGAETAESKPVETERPPVLTYMVSKNGYLFIGANPEADAMQFFQNIGKDGKRLSTAPVFTSVTAKANPADDVFLYANLGRVFNSNPEAMKYFTPNIADKNRTGSSAENSYSKSLSYLKDYQGMGVAVNLKSSDLKANFVLNVLEKSVLLTMFKGVTPKRDIILGIKDNPLMLMGIVENVQTYWKMIQDALDKNDLNTIKQQFATIKTDYSIDVENDIIQNLGHNFSLGMYDAMSINMANINTVAVIEFKDPVKMKAVMEKFIAKMPPEQQSTINRVQINGSEVYMVPAGPVQLYAGFIGNNLAITLGKPMFEKAMSAELENGFIKAFKDEPLRTSLQKDISIFFFDVGEAMYAVKNFAPMLAATSPEAQIVMTPEFQNIVAPFNYISAVSRIDGNAMVGEFLFKTSFDKPFFQGLKDVTAQIQALTKKLNLAKPADGAQSASDQPSAPTDAQSSEQPEKTE